MGIGRLLKRAALGLCHAEPGRGEGAPVRRGTERFECHYSDELVQGFARLDATKQQCVFVGDQPRFERFVRGLSAKQGRDAATRFLRCDPSALSGSEFPAVISGVPTDSIGAFVIALDEPRLVRKVAEPLVRSDRYRHIPIVYNLVAETAYAKAFREHDLPLFRRNLFIDDEFDFRLFDEIYLDSLSRFEQKCQVRDAMDLFQCLRRIQDLPGDVIEIGSYKGHSGYLISAYLERFRWNHTVYLCDTFDKFPDERLGIDRAWGGTHEVDFQKVRDCFHDKPNVRFIQGDVRDTLSGLKDKRFSLAYIDCDSYATTQFSCEFLWPRILSGGILVDEDYGSPWTLGARIAVDDYFNDRKDHASFFSFFSGLKIFHRLPKPLPAAP